MCEKCKELLNVPIGKKAKTTIKSWENKIASGCTEMVLDRYSDKIETFIHSEQTEKETGCWSNVSFDIKNCPFCGEILV